MTALAAPRSVTPASSRPAFARVGIWLIAAAAVVFATLAIGSPVASRSLQSVERTTLDTTVAEYQQAMDAKNFDHIVETIPPKILDLMASRVGAEAAALKPMIVDLMKRSLEQMSLEHYSMDQSTQVVMELPDGAPYVLIPTRTVFKASDELRVQLKSHTLAIQDAGKWYLVRVAEAAHMAILQQVYPEFAGVEFPRGSMEVLKK